MRDIRSDRGFITIATGDIRYYHLAKNLLHSYRYHSKTPYPFAILCDRENEITSEFDDVIILDNPTNSYNDKLLLFDYMPYEETIFCDADSLAYGDLNDWFQVFSNDETTKDFSCFGYAYRDLNSKKGWFSPAGMGKYASDIFYIPSFNGGVYYLRNSEKCARVFQIAKEAAKEYYQYSFLGFRDPADEPVLALGMAVCGCEPLDMHEVAFAPKRSAVRLDIVSGTAQSEERASQYRLVHWSNYLTLKSWYRFEVGKLVFLLKNKRKNFVYKLLYDYRMAYAALWVTDILAFYIRVKRKIKKLCKKKRFFSSLKH